MKEQLITFETAKLAKEKKFDWMSSRKYDLNSKKILEVSYWEGDGDVTTIGVKNDDIESDEFLAPTQYLLKEWIEANFNIVIYLKPSYDHLNCELKGFYFTLNNKHGSEVDRLYFSLDDKYKGFEIMLKEALELIK